MDKIKYLPIMLIVVLLFVFSAIIFGRLEYVLMALLFVILFFLIYILTKNGKSSDRSNQSTNTGYISTLSSEQFSNVDEIDFLPTNTEKTWTSKYAYIYNDVKIFIPPDREPDYESIKFDRRIELIQEPDNEYDSGAIKVMQNGNFIGYMYRGTLQNMINDWIELGLPVDAEMSQYSKSNKTAHINLKFPYKYQPNIFKFKLIGNRSVEMQENIELCDEGDPVDIEYNYDRCKYAVSAGFFEIGYLPKSAEKYISDDNVEAVIDMIEEDDDEKYIVFVAIKDED